MPWDIWNSKDSGAAGSSKKDSLSKKAVRHLKKKAAKAPKGSTLRSMSDKNKALKKAMEQW